MGSSVASANQRAGYDKYETTASLGLGELTYEVDIENLSSLAKFVDNYPSAIERGIYNGMKRFSLALGRKLRQRLVSHGLGGSELMYNFHTEFDGSTITLFIDSDFAIYVEMGTGIVGEIFSHPDQAKLGISWEYDVEKHGLTGWTYRTEDGQFFHTIGQGSRPYIYETYKWAEASIANYIRKDIIDELKKLGVKVK